MGTVSMLPSKGRKKLYQYVMDELGLRIVRGTYPPGETLPNEDALGQEFGVSRGVLREATKVLIEKGLIQSRPKTGTRILPRQSWNLFDPDVLSWRYKSGNPLEFLRNITEVRRIVEAEAARMAAARATALEIEPIQAAYREMEELLAREDYPVEDFIALDLKFHYTILDASQNELMAQIGLTMRQALLTGRQIDDRHDRDVHQASLRSHLAILEAIAANDPQGAHRAAEGHIDDVWLDIQQRMPGPG